MFFFRQDYNRILIRGGGRPNACAMLTLYPRGYPGLLGRLPKGEGPRRSDTKAQGLFVKAERARDEVSFLFACRFKSECTYLVPALGLFEAACMEVQSWEIKCGSRSGSSDSDGEK